MRKQLMLFFLLLFVFLGFGQDINQTFENGNTAYNAGQFEKATMFYKEILESGEHSAALYFNIANCYYRLNNVAESIFFFEKAKQLNPLDEDIKINSTFAQNMAIDAVELLPKSQITIFQESLVGLFDQEMISNSVLFDPITKLGEYLFNWGSKFTEDLPDDLI